MYKRDSKIVKELKELYKNQCQICGESLINHDSLGYSEVNHIQPLSKKGPDSKENMIVLCPNHHVLMDLGIISIRPEDQKTIYHVDKTNPLHLKKLAFVHHDINHDFVAFHYENIYSQMLKIFNK